MKSYVQLALSFLHIGVALSIECYQCNSNTDSNCNTVDDTTNTVSCNGPCAVFRGGAGALLRTERFCSDSHSCNTWLNVSASPHIDYYVTGYASCCKDSKCNMEGFVFNGTQDNECYSCFYATAGAFSIGDTNCKDLDPVKTPRVPCGGAHCASYSASYGSFSGILRQCTTSCDKSKSVKVAESEFPFTGKHCADSLCDATKAGEDDCRGMGGSPGGGSPGGGSPGADSSADISAINSLVKLFVSVVAIISFCR